MFKLAVQFLFCTAAVPLAAYFLPGVTVQSMEAAILVGACLSVLYLLLRPIIRLLLCVINAFTLGILGLAIDWALVLLTAYLFPGQLAFENAWWALAIAVIANVLRAIGGKLAKSRK